MIFIYFLFVTFCTIIFARTIIIISIVFVSIASRIRLKHTQTCQLMILLKLVVNGGVDDVDIRFSGA